MKNFNQIFKIIVAVAIFIVACSVAYYYVIALPFQKQAELDFQKQQEEQRIEDEQRKEEKEEREKEVAEEEQQKKEEEAILIKKIEEQEQIDLLNYCLNNADAKYKHMLDYIMEKAETECGFSVTCIEFYREAMDEQKIDKQNERNECYKKYQ